MPADLSRERLGERVLNLMDDMANWGQRKYVPGEVDVFTLDHTHELYGHMNINYVQLDRIPRYDEGWQPVLDALKGKFFVTTGEILIPKFTVGGRGSGDTLKLDPASKPTAVVARLRGTFPLRFAEIVSGDGREVHRQRIDLSDTSSFGQKDLSLEVNLAGRTWVRLEAWDVACNGAFTQPVWLKTARKSKLRTASLEIRTGSRRMGPTAEGFPPHRSTRTTTNSASPSLEDSCVGLAFRAMWLWRWIRCGSVQGAPGDVGVGGKRAGQ